MTVSQDKPNPLTFHHDCNKPTIDVMYSTKKPLSILMGYAGKQCCQFVIGFIALVFGSMAQMVVPGLIGVVVDAMIIQDWDAINFYCLSMLLIVVVSGIATAIRGATFNTISERIALQLRYDLLYFVINKDIGFFDT